MPSLQTCLALLLLPAFSIGCNSFDEDLDVVRIASDDDTRLDALSIICESTFSLAGTFTPSEPPPAGEESECWPVGDWTVSATLDFKGCDPQQDFGSPRVYRITIDDADELSSLFPEDPNNERISLNVISHGGPDCEGQFDHFELDSSVWSLRPVLHPDGSITGSATYAVYEEDSYSD